MVLAYFAVQDLLWFNMREEPVVYINGLPFVLREQRRPLKNLQVCMVLLSGVPVWPSKGSSGCCGCCHGARGLGGRGG